VWNYAPVEVHDLQTTLSHVRILTPFFDTEPCVGHSRRVCFSYHSVYCCPPLSSPAFSVAEFEARWVTFIGDEAYDSA